MEHQIISWFDSRPGIKKEDYFIEHEKIPFKLARLYIQLLEETDGGSPNTSDFEYFDGSYNKKIGQAVGVFYSLVSREDINIIDEYNNPPEFFPENLVAFAETGNGDLICFDYRTDPQTDNSPIVYWNHEADIGKDVSFVAKDFEEFLTMLHEPEEA